MEEVAGDAQMSPEPRRQGARSMQLLSALQIGFGVIAARGSTMAAICHRLDFASYWNLPASLSSCSSVANLSGNEEDLKEEESAGEI